ncbi:phage major tail tube protein [Chitinimonas sp. BJB300]|uniref:phage major tail tube protein n=1 Tax=Chitinimonas sp. BJB300 TaxID=1559339 RepID=UPI000C113A0E|nr:phage major tail tube protein [Chitinimonas sp. BJB300]PHV11310.1 phage major tail tube protein [Chitinimonas sp. BJB300]TSJ88203.1 phage major tail tube protein [Chitinimonas sp. BJB300]
MALPRKLKYFNTFMDGVDHAGEATEVTLPKLSRKFEDFRAGGMDGPVGIDMGQEKLEMEITYGGLIREALNQYAATKHDAVLLRFAGYYQREDSLDYDAVEIVVRGRIQELDYGSGKAGDDTTFKAKLHLSYYKQIINGATVIEIDQANMVLIVNGQDRLAAARKAIGR